MREFCASCGSARATDATVCAVCGEAFDAPTAEAVPVAGADNPVESAGTPASTATHSNVAAAAPDIPPPSSTAFRDYLMTSILSVVLAFIVYMVSAPEEKKGPPMPEPAAGASSGMPEGHPPTDAGALPPGHPPAEGTQATPEQQKQLAALEKQVAEKPTDFEAKLKLANLYYDLDQHALAAPLYEEYLRRNPANADARTDMAFSIANNGDVERAIGELSTVIKAQPRHQNAAYNLAMMYLTKRNRDSTLFWFRRVAEIDSTSRAGKTAVMILRDVTRKDSTKAQ